MSLTGKIGLVTGASRGIGKAIAVALAEAGADVACAAVTADHAKETVALIEALGRRAVAVGGRVERGADVERFFQAAGAALGPVDILVNNAGIASPRPVLEMSEADWDATLDVNAKGAFLCAQAAARGMRERGAPGAIINIGSIAGQNAFPLRLAYCASKAALHQMTRVMAVEWAPLGIRVNCIAPGYINTEMVKSLSAEGNLDRGALERRTPQGRLGEPEEVARLAVFLAGEDASYITGSVLTVDGGWDAYGFV